MVRLMKWHCEHCTYINDATAHVCEMCHKTSDTPMLISPDDNISPAEFNTGPCGDNFGEDPFINMLDDIRFVYFCFYNIYWK